MDDLISRQAAIDAIDRLILPQVKGETAAEEINRVAWRCAINCAEEMIGHLPSAERRGRWIRTGEDGYCSICNCDMPMYKEDWEWRYLETPYCPNCGARMDGGENG